MDTECVHPGGMEAAEMQGDAHVQAEEQEHVEEEDVLFEVGTRCQSVAEDAQAYEDLLFVCVFSR